MLIATWILYTVVGILVFSLAFVWAVRARQFWNQDRARYLPLEGETPTEVSRESRGVPGSMLVMIVLGVSALAMVALTLIMAYVHG